MPELAFFVGKGGVGKTTVSSAYAIWVAAEHPEDKVLLVSTDPAHSLSDVLEARIGSSPKAIAVGTRRNLFGWEIDSERFFANFLHGHKSALIEAVERSSLFTVEEVSSLLDTALPGMSEMGALLAIQDTFESGKYETIVVDTAPFGHTLRLFGMPGEFEKLLDFLQLAAERDQVLAQHFGGTAQMPKSDFVGEWRTKLRQMRAAFESARVFLVTTAEEFALKESIRCIRQLNDARLSPRVSGIVLNRIVQNVSRCPSCESKRKAADRARRRLAHEYKQVDLFVAEDPGFPITGGGQLKQLGNAIFGRKRLCWGSPIAPAQVPGPRFSRAEWPEISAPLGFVLGKGGVGKTTISAALAVHSRQCADEEVHICSVDPAPSLDDIFQVEVTDTPRAVLGDAGLCASELDSVALYKTWVSQMRDDIEAATSSRQSGVRVDLSYERQLFSQLLEIVPPGLDEVLAMFRIMELSRRNLGKVIIDMAPTGHALELLRTPERILVWSRLLLKSLASHRKLALAREAAVKIAELEMNARELSQALKSTDVEVFAVMLPEPLPDRETGRLLQELRALRICAGSVFVNRVLETRRSVPCSRCRSAAAWQAKMLSGLKKRLRVKAVYAVPEFEHGPSGKRALLQLTRNLWQIS